MMDAAERALLEETVRSALADERGAPDADAALAGLGWREMLESEPDVALAVVFDALGRTNRTATALDDAMAAALGLAPRADLAVLLPAFGTWEMPGARGLATARVARADSLLVVVGAGAAARAVTVSTADADVRRVHGIDPAAGFHAVTVERVTGTETALDAAAWASAVAFGRRAAAHEIAGAARTMLAFACDHARERVQFGRPVARFQAVRHHLAEALVAIEALDATLGAAADERTPLTAALAKASAGRAARTVASHCQQVLAGIGFTTDHPFHRYLKRTMLLEGLFGAGDDIACDIGRRLLTTRKVPTLIDL